MTSRKHAVLICGPMRAGKTSAASYLNEKYGHKKYSLAGKLKELFTVFTGSFEKNRDWLQSMGQSLRVVFGEDFWVHRLIEHIDEESPEMLTVDDVRYKNELKWLYEYCTQRYEKVDVVLVKVSHETQIIRGSEVQFMNHESELFSRQLQNTHGGDLYFEYEGIPLRIIDGNLPLSEYYEVIEESLKPPASPRISFPTLFDSAEESLVECCWCSDDE